MYAREKVVGINAVKKASILCQSVFKKLVKESLEKTDQSPVTVADFGAQAVINHLLHQSFPNDAIVGEEDSSELMQEPSLLKSVVELTNEALATKLSEKEVTEAIDLGRDEGGMNKRFWTLDPIDGTKGFLRGGQYAICLALIENGDVKLAIQGCPNLPLRLGDPLSPRGSLFTAVKGHGAFQQRLLDDIESKIRVSDIINSKDALFCESVEAAHSSHSISASIAKELEITKESVRMDSQCKYAIVSRGEADIYLRIPTRMDYEEKIWVISINKDHAGGSLLIQEAGGMISDIYGNTLDFGQGRTLKSKGIIATNGAFHDKVLAAVQKSMK